MSVSKAGSAGARVSRLRDKALCQPSICIERGLLMTQSYKETESEMPVVRRAKALEKILSEMTISIDGDELIVGRATTKQRGAPLIPEISWKWYLDEMETFSTRQYDRFTPLSGEAKAQMSRFLPYWDGQALGDRWNAVLPEEDKQKYFKLGLPNSSPINGQHLSHNAVDFEKVLALGLNGVRKEVEEELKAMDMTDLGYFDKSQFLKAIIISLDAAARFAERHGELAETLAQSESEPKRRAELLKIAGICRQVPAGPARSFHEALQSVWFVFVALMVEGWGNGLAFGRADQYWYPFYKKDIAEGRLTKEEALELIEMFFIRIQGMVTAQSEKIVRRAAGFSTVLDITIGGVTKTGGDAVNELTYLFLDADEAVRLQTPEIVIRVSKSNPDAFLLRVCRALKSLNGKYKFISDDTIIKQLLSDGKSIEHARDYIVAGCRAPTVAGRAFDLPGSTLNIALMLELALNNGVSRLTGEQIGPKTGDPRRFKSYDEVWEAYKKQVEAQIPFMIYMRNADRQFFVEFAPTPLQSGLSHGCIRSGRDVANGGTQYNTQALAAPGGPNVADSLAAIKKCVFEDNRIGMSELIDALDRDF